MCPNAEIMPWSFLVYRKDSHRISDCVSAVPISDGHWYAIVDAMQPVQLGIFENGSKLRARY